MIDVTNILLLYIIGVIVSLLIMKIYTLINNKLQLEEPITIDLFLFIALLSWIGSLMATIIIVIVYVIFWYEVYIKKNIYFNIVNKKLINFSKWIHNKVVGDLW